VKLGLDEKGVEWEQRSMDSKFKKVKWMKFDELINCTTKCRVHCPKCNQPMTKGSWIKKFWKIENHCFDCQIDIGA
jgi:hypothetical protein